MAEGKNKHQAPGGTVDHAGEKDAQGRKKETRLRQEVKRKEGQEKSGDSQGQKGEENGKEKKDAAEKVKQKKERERTIRSGWSETSALSGKSKEKLGEDFAVAVGQALVEAQEKMAPEEFFKKILLEFIKTNFGSSGEDNEERIRSQEELLDDIWIVVKEKDSTKRKEQKIALGEKYNLNGEKAENLFKLLDIFAEAWVSLRDREVDPAEVRRQMAEGGGDFNDKLKNWIGAPGGILFSLATLFAVVGVLSLIKLSNIMLGKKGKGK